MSIREVSLFIEGQIENDKEEWRRTQIIAWSVMQSQSSKAIPLDGFLGLSEGKSKRSGITKEEHLELVANYNRRKAKENGKQQSETISGNIGRR